MSLASHTATFLQHQYRRILRQPRHKGRPTYRANSRCSILFEQFESRLLLSTLYWGGGDGNWSDCNWYTQANLSGTPTTLSADDTAIIQKTGSISTFSIGGDSPSLQSVVVSTGATLTHSGNLTVVNFENDGILNLIGGTVSVNMFTNTGTLDWKGGDVTLTNGQLKNSGSLNSFWGQIILDGGNNTFTLNNSELLYQNGSSISPPPPSAPCPPPLYWTSGNIVFENSSLYLMYTDAMFNAPANTMTFHASTFTNSVAPSGSNGYVQWLAGDLVFENNSTYSSVGGAIAIPGNGNVTLTLDADTSFSLAALSIPQTPFQSPLYIAASFTNSGTLNWDSNSTSQLAKVSNNGTVVFSPPANLVALSGNASVTGGKVYTLTTGTVFSSISGTVTGYLVDWGDNQITQYSVNDTKTHTYDSVVSANYTITVDILTSTGSYVSSATKTVTVNGTAPFAPSALACTVATTSMIHLTWTDNSSNETGFVVERSTDGINFSQVATLAKNTTSYDDTDLVTDSSYWYRVKAINASGESGYTDVATATTYSLMQPLSTAGWTATASASATSNPPALAFDGNMGTFWTTGKAQASGQTFTLDMGSLQTFSQLILDAGSSASSAGAPASYEIDVSSDNKTWVNSIATGSSTSQVITISFVPQTARYIRIKLTGSSKSNWSIAELNVNYGTNDVPVPDNPVTIRQVTEGIYKRLVITGTSGNNSILVSLSGSTLIIVANGQTQTASTTGITELAIYGGDGNDIITVDSSVNIISLLYDYVGNNTLTAAGSAQSFIVTIGDSDKNTLTGNGINTAFWANPTDTVNASPTEIANGCVHLISSFYNDVSTQLAGQKLLDPTGGKDINGNQINLDYSNSNYSNYSLFGAGPSDTDIHQGNLGDCYFLAAISSLAHSLSASLMQMAVDLGDGSYAVQFMRTVNGVVTTTYVRVDGDLPKYGGSLYANRPTSGGAIWGCIMEKAYALFRADNGTTNINPTYNSLNSGFPGNVFNDLGVGSTPFETFTVNTSGNLVPVDTGSLFQTLQDAIAAGKAIAIDSDPAPTGLTLIPDSPIVGGHTYSIFAVFTDSDGVKKVTLKNPWGIDGTIGTSYYDGTNDGLITIAIADLPTWFSMGAISM
ncbi:MAG: discoidin domain-containing protein [Phycisphaerales bacterium]|nr:discoidin domain-containing protein [Phycisphaerales bacterium]